MIERYAKEPLKSLWSDEEKWKHCLQVELKVVEFLHHKGVVSKEEWSQIKEKADFSTERIGELEARLRHDVISFVTNVEENIGPAGRWIHFGLTSSDVLDTALSLRMQKALEVIIVTGRKALYPLLTFIEEHRETLIMGRTHGVYAEPMSLGFKLFVYYSELTRRLDELEKTKELVRVGKLSGAVGMNLYFSPEEEEQILASLGLRACPEATQVLPRDLWAQVSSQLALTASSLEKFAQEIRLLHRTEVAEIQEGFRSGQRGSSAMPHKKNPILCERICGLARIVRSLSLAQMETVALWHERDLSNSSCERITLPDQTSLVYYLFTLLETVLSGLYINEEKIAENLERSRGLFWSGFVLNQLVEKGLKRNEAYEIVQKVALRCGEEDLDFLSELGREPQVEELFSPSDWEKLKPSIFWKQAVSKLEGLIL